MPLCASNKSTSVREETATVNIVQNPLLKKYSGTHTACRNNVYSGGIERSNVPDKYVNWKKTFKQYDPVVYLAPSVKAQPVWADNPDNLRKLKFNEDDDDGANRKSFMGTYKVDPITAMPINPMGRTGMAERGLLGKFGPNFAADPIVTRWKRDENGSIVLDKMGRKTLELVVITRRDTGEKAIPGGMVDKGEQVSLTLKREFGEEAMDSIGMSDEERSILSKNLDIAFAHGVLVYNGYVDDPRNTDNAWMETTAMLFHDEDGSLFSSFNFKAGDDAAGVEWAEVTPELKLYANHDEFVGAVYKHLVGKKLKQIQFQVAIFDIEDCEYYCILFY